MPRLFIAIYPTPEAAHRMLALLEPLELHDHRPTPPDQVHLTVHFLGEVPDRDVDSTIESVQRSAAGLPALALTPQRLTTLPEHGDPRLIALETDAPATLHELHARLIRKLPRPGVRPGPRSFRPHLTLARFVHGQMPAPLQRPVTLAPFPVTHIRLMRSDLRQGGARHTTLHAAALETS